MKSIGSFGTLVVCVCVLAAYPSQAQNSQTEIQQLKEQIKLLMQRVDTLESQNARLEQKVAQSQETIQQASEQVSTLTETVAATANTAQNSITSKYGAELYGYLKLDASYDDSHVSPGNYATYVMPELGGADDSQFNITANQSRFGLNLKGPELGNAKTSGKIEVDFYGGGAENKPHLRLRHAYAQIEWPDYDLAVLAGQTWDVISPSYPTMLNFLPLWDAGNIGYRRPQLRVTKGFDLGGDSKLTFENALTRTIGDDVLGNDTGSDSGFPTMQSRVAYSFPGLADKKTEVGLSGHYGQEENDKDNQDYDSWSLNLDLAIPLFTQLTFRGELFTGENLDAYYGGIGQGVNSLLGREIPANGGWASLSYTPVEQWNFNVGAGFDNPEDYYVVSGGRTRNIAYFGNAIYMLNPSMLVGLEVSYWQTDYKDIDDGDALRLQTSLIYKF
ncbi:MAG: hypothetical protein GC154_02275 [bacterium]|nr:hypothetical protein [bacterium]